MCLGKSSKGNAAAHQGADNEPERLAEQQATTTVVQDDATNTHSSDSKKTAKYTMEYTLKIDDVEKNITPELFEYFRKACRQLSKKPKSIRRLSRQLSEQLTTEASRSCSYISENLPETPSGWTVFVSALCSVVLGYEVQLQKRLTCPPIVYGQIHEGPMKSIYNKLNGHPGAILSRNIRPSLFVGTRQYAASMAACTPGGPGGEKHVRFRQILTMSHDGATIAMDWELPLRHKIDSPTPKSPRQRKNQILNGPIKQPVVLILHGAINDSSFWYVQTMMRACTNRGWIAAGMNMRGCGRIPITTPRAYNNAFTGDIRCVVNHIATRLADDVPMFLVGYSLGANIVSKYLGEEGLNESLPKCVAGAVSLGNPLEVHGKNLSSPMKEMIGFGAKLSGLYHYLSLRKFTDPNFQKDLHKAIFAKDINGVEALGVPNFVRNEEIYPFAVRIGFKDIEEYWMEASSYRLMRNVSVPLLQLIASDDFIVSDSFKSKLAYVVQNPNVMFVETQCGGHLGWQESPPNERLFGPATSWADRATADFIQAILSAHGKGSGKDGRQKKQSSKHKRSSISQNIANPDSVPVIRARL